MGRQIIPQPVERFAFVRRTKPAASGGDPFRHPRPALADERYATGFQPLRCGIHACSENIPRRLCNVFHQRVENIENSGCSAKVIELFFPDPFGTVCQHGHVRGIQNSQTPSPLSPATTETITRFDGSEGDPRCRRGKLTSGPFFRSGRIPCGTPGKKSHFHFSPATDRIHTRSIRGEFQVPGGSETRQT